MPSPSAHAWGLTTSAGRKCSCFALCRGRCPLCLPSPWRGRCPAGAKRGVGKVSRRDSFSVPPPRFLPAGRVTFCPARKSPKSRQGVCAIGRFGTASLPPCRPPPRTPIPAFALCRGCSHPARGACVLAYPSLGPPALLGLFGKASATPRLRLGGAPFEGSGYLPPPSGADPPSSRLPPSGGGVPEGRKGGEKTCEQKRAHCAPIPILCIKLSHICGISSLFERV